MIQSLVYSGVDNDQVTLLDTFRARRNSVDYRGEAVDGAFVEACIQAAERLRQHIFEWLKDRRPELIDSGEKERGD